MKPKVLVIGSKDHSRANCVDWLQPLPNIEEYESIIINMQSLTQKVYDKIQMKIRDMKESISTIFKTKREIFCIMNKLITPSPAPRAPGPVFKSIRLGPPPPTNYDWLPTEIEIDDRKSGSSIALHDDEFEKYFEYVDRWNLTLSIINADFMISPIATNKSSKAIAGTLMKYHVDPFTKPRVIDSGCVYLLPAPTKCNAYQAIEILLDLFLGEEGKIVPCWRKDIEVPMIPELEEKIRAKIEKIKGIQQEISQLTSQMRKWDSYRDLLTATDSELVNIVQKALADIGIKTKKTEKGFPVDLISNEVAVEITGIKGRVGVSSKKAIQTSRFKESYHKGEKIILVANTHVDLSPKNRKGKMDFSPEVKKYFESLGVCCLATTTLFKLWKDVITKKKLRKDVKRKILDKDGELTLS